MDQGQRTYLDYNATAPLRPRARDALVSALALVGNASSVHGEGRRVRALVEGARDSVARLVGASARDVIFTSGGTEASALALSPGFRRRSGASPELLLVGAGEHPCVLDGHRFPADRVERIPLRDDGLVDLVWLQARLARHDGGPALVSIQLANNETGIIQPVAEAAAIARAHGGLIHTDAVQAAGKIAVSIAGLGVDALSLSAHKLGGPQGVGALVLAGDDYEIAPLLRGGGQERSRRAGTENAAGIAAFGAVAQDASDDLDTESARLLAMRAAFEAEIRRITPDVVFFGEEEQRLPGTILFAVPGRKAETALISLDLAGAALSSGSACSSGKVKRSHVLDAMGVPADLAECALRLSFGWATCEDDVIRFSRAFEKAMSSRSVQEFRAA
ncbi:MAG: cysteine desulfurase [Salinarimonadaceae bacterium]|nr:MAG: cysteine desulfurase [Salinarimonadaceae bacterium]